ncbi:hypothetical protein BC936DRAFT_142248 [Jimgerdemannia flammicorona]|uniref:Uncharacterized protein n=1 Tax=Jimgerdemannia flammicorona TaxID=994334 RepID=A0A433A0N2_9FUNG|nr:hypothetical protein BC936DRAFT_142248 [Jimgerdemannia flammicorona]
MIYIEELREIVDAGRDIAKPVIPCIQDAMLPAYEECLKQKGPGLLPKMRKIINNHRITKLREKLNTCFRNFEKHAIAALDNNYAVFQDEAFGLCSNPNLVASAEGELAILLKNLESIKTAANVTEDRIGFT